MIPVRRMPGRPVMLGGIAAVALLTGAGVTLAVTSGAPVSSAATTAAGQATASPTPSPPPGPGRHWFGMHKAPFRMWDIGPGMGAFGSVHGQFVVPKSGGGYQTIDTQRGTVTAVSSTSISVKSSDGFTKTYKVTGDTIVDAHRDGISSVKTGQQVMVSGTVSGSTVTATSIADVSLLPSFGGHMGLKSSMPAGTG